MNRALMSQEKSTRIPQDCMEAATLGGRPKGIGPLTVWSESCIVQTRREAASMLRCAALNGKPFWANGVCPTYASTNKQGINHCSAYRQFPYEQFINHYDHSNSEGRRNAVTRASVLAYGARYGDEKTATLLHKLSKTSSCLTYTFSVLTQVMLENRAWLIGSTCS